MTVSFEQARTALSQRLEGGAFEHSERVADTAEGLATIYGVDTEKARLAGLLHDWDRSASHDELFEAARSRGIAIGDAERGVPYLLHALTGAAAVAEALPDVDNDVIRAIERHTVGAPDMTELDKVVYLADMLEPARRFPGADSLREAVGELTLDALFMRAYEHSLIHLVSSRKWIHPVTIDVWNSLAAGARDE